MLPNKCSSLLKPIANKSRVSGAIEREDVHAYLFVYKTPRYKFNKRVKANREFPAGFCFNIREF